MMKDDLFHKLYKWIPPKQKPDDLTEEEFNSYLQTEEGNSILGEFSNIPEELQLEVMKKNIKRSI